jgi:hypothetical protein
MSTKVFSRPVLMTQEMNETLNKNASCQEVPITNDEWEISCSTLGTVQAPNFTTEISNLRKPTVTSSADNFWVYVHNVTCSWMNSNQMDIATVILKLY